MKEKLVVIGNGMSGMRTVEELIRMAPDKYEITVFGAEPHGNYNRIMLSPVLSGEKTIEEIMIHDLAWYKTNNIALHCGEGKSVVAVDRVHQKVVAEDGLTAHYDRLLISTGSSPYILPVPGHKLEGVIGFRDIADVETMLTTAKSRKHAVVIGGGLLGLEAANGLALQGMDVTVIHRAKTLMNRQLDEQAALLLQQSLEAKGLKFILGANTQEILGNEKGQASTLTLTTGDSLPADLVVMTAGIQPNISLAQDMALQCDKGILVNDTMQTYDPKIYAVGECVQHRGELFGLVAPLWDQAKVCANHLAGFGSGIYKSLITSTKLKVTGIDLFSAGEFLGGDDYEDIVYQDLKQGIYKKVVIKDDKIVGAVLYGDTIDGAWYFDLMRKATKIDTLRADLIFGQAIAEAA